MNVLLTITAGLDTGPFDIYTNVDNFTTPIQTGITKAALVAGYMCTVVPNNATVIRVKSTGDCTNFVDANINFAYPSPTPTHTPTPTPTPTPTLSSFILNWTNTKDCTLGYTCAPSYGNIKVNGVIVYSWDRFFSGTHSGSGVYPANSTIVVTASCSPPSGSGCIAPPYPLQGVESTTLCVNIPDESYVQCVTADINTMTITKTYTLNHNSEIDISTDCN